MPLPSYTKASFTAERIPKYLRAAALRTAGLRCFPLNCSQYFLNRGFTCSLADYPPLTFNWIPFKSVTCPEIWGMCNNIQYLPPIPALLTTRATTLITQHVVYLLEPIQITLHPLYTGILPQHNYCHVVVARRGGIRQSPKKNHLWILNV